MAHITGRTAMKCDILYYFVPNPKFKYDRSLFKIYVKIYNVNYICYCKPISLPHIHLIQLTLVHNIVCICGRYLCTQFVQRVYLATPRRYRQQIAKVVYSEANRTLLPGSVLRQQSQTNVMDAVTYREGPRSLMAYSTNPITENRVCGLNKTINVSTRHNDYRWM